SVLYASRNSVATFGGHRRSPGAATRRPERAGARATATERLNMSKLRLSMACWNYDRTRALLEDRVPVDGIDLTYINIPVEETFFRMIRHSEFDVAEMSLSSYTLSMFRDPKPFVAIPVFPS